VASLAQPERGRRTGRRPAPPMPPSAWSAPREPERHEVQMRPPPNWWGELHDVVYCGVDGVDGVDGVRLVGSGAWSRTCSLSCGWCNPTPFPGTGVAETEPGHPQDHFRIDAALVSSVSAGNTATDSRWRS
jgi:hypothetical protein